MKTMLACILLFGIFSSCNSGAEKIKALQNRIDSLEARQQAAYKPGLGEFMSNIQVHHAKLWFAGKNQNWQLADFEIHEIMESLDDIKQFASDRKETALIGMLNPALDSINHAIASKNSQSFKNSFVFLTNTCNNCHFEAGYTFNAVKIPETAPFSNQDFSPSRANK